MDHWLLPRTFILFLMTVVMYLTAVGRANLGPADSLTGQSRHGYITASLATSFGGPSRAIECAMAASGFDSMIPFGFGSPTQYPYSSTGIGETGFPWLISAGVTIVAPVAVELQVGNTPIGLTMGYGGRALDLVIEYSVFSYCALLSCQVTDWLRLSGGPAWYRCRSDREVAGRRIDTRSVSLNGGMVATRFSIPLSSRLSLGLGVQYHLVGEAQFGPYILNTIERIASVPAFNGRYDHAVLLLGFDVNY